MNYINLKKENKVQIKELLTTLNDLLRKSRCRITMHTDLYSIDQGHLGSIEDDGSNLYLLDDDTMIEYCSSEEE